MPSQPSRRRLRVAAIAALSAGLMCTAAPAAWAEPEAPADAPAAGASVQETPAAVPDSDAPLEVDEAPATTVEAARQRIEQLQRESAAAAERANGARAELERSQERMTLFAGQLTDARVDLSRQQQALEAIARQLYVNGGVGSAALSFSLDDPERFLSELDQLIAASDSQSEILIRARARALSLKNTGEAMAREQQRLADAITELGAQEGLAQIRLAEAEQVLADLQEAERARLEEEARQAQETARLEAAMLLAGGGAGVGASDALSSVPEGAVGRVIEFALSKVGGPYVWGGSGPVAYDCSGLTQAAWAQAGVSLTHYSGTQYREGRPVALDALQPGDLVFFYSINTHVGMYIGEGRFVHAANSRDGIRIDNLSGHYRENLVAASRPAL